MRGFRVALAAGVLAMVMSASAGAGTIVSGYIGSHKLSYNVREIVSTTTYDLEGPADYVAITEIYPDRPASAEYHYTVSGKGIAGYERRRHGIGFGPETYFIAVSGGRVGTIAVRNLSKEPVRILRVWSVTKPQLEKLLAKDSFRVMGLVFAGDDGDGLVKMLAENLRPKPEYHISTGFSAEIRCANQPIESVRRELENCARWSKKYSLPAMLGLVSWWSGTPLREPDGLGGHFGDIQYQQFCYAPDMEQPEDAGLKAALRDRYSRHYCLSVPNQWSSTPWLTMNSKRMNDYRYRRMDEALAMVKAIGGGDPAWVDSIYLENEPRYWDTACEDGNDKRHAGTLWADFNPLAVADAKRDGVELDPSDGLSDEELSWLHRNVGRYNQECVEAVRKSMRSNGFPAMKPLYTHSLQHKDMFPGGGIGHAASEWAYADGARTGLEGLWCQAVEFSRIREWGRWANINREENDGRHIDEHLWDLRVAYVMGGDIYNSYNWDAIGAQRVFDYIDEFMSNLPVVTLPPAEAKLAGDHIELKTPMKLQAFTRLQLPVEALRQVKGVVRATLADPDGRLIASSNAKVDVKPGMRGIAFNFPTPAESPCRAIATLRLQVLDARGRVFAGSIRLIDESASGMKLSLDLRTQRALSLAVIARSGRR